MAFGFKENKRLLNVFAHLDTNVHVLPSQIIQAKIFPYRLVKLQETLKIIVLSHHFIDVQGYRAKS